jgi:catechol 2,3-dioxygenase-like lactoylglutathione lyase family enzyme
VQRSFTNILSKDVKAAGRFYERFLGLVPELSSETFILMGHPQIPGWEFAILSKNDDSIPPAFQQSSGGIIVTFIVDDCDAIYQRATHLKLDIVDGPADMSYGYRRLLVQDPDGTVLDISSAL